MFIDNSLPHDVVETEAVRLLESTGRYRVLRPVPSLPPMPDDLAGAREGVFLDVETTGLDPERHKVIELAMIRFAFNDAGEILGALAPFAAFNDPGEPIPANITRLTGIDDAMVKGRVIDLEAIDDYLDGVELIIAHNAAFDRLFAERVSFDFFRAWGCSIADVDWSAEGFEGTKLSYLLIQRGWFHHAHRAEADCAAALALLNAPLPVSGRTPLAEIVERSRLETMRIRAVGAPFEVKNLLKERGYRWDAGAANRERCWYRDLLPDEADTEIGYLRDCLGVNPSVTRISALYRFRSPG